MNTCPLLELYKYSINISYVQLVVFVIAMVFGTLIMWKPRKVIEIEIAVYRAFNWKIEPISMEKEIRNTRSTGAIVFIFGIAALLYVMYA
ncbi:MAG: hypothetical protein JSV93_06325 [Candidatus Omnitrophota bacterium]|nr:MAG: hypothetical protein JSV93_06325 [Candidatus Omnitrophota bacterium]